MYGHAVEGRVQNGGSVELTKWYTLGRNSKELAYVSRPWLQGGRAATRGVQRQAITRGGKRALGGWLLARMCCASQPVPSC